MTSSDDYLDSGGREPPSQEGGSKLFLGGLSWGTSEEKLREHFETYGEILEVVVMKDRNTGKPRGFGFITYKEPNIADSVVKDIHIIDGRQIDTKKSIPQESTPKARKIFVGGLSPETTEDEFKTYFQTFGEVSEIQIMQDHMTGRSRGFGFITFEEDISAQKVFEAGTMHELGGKQVEVKPATPKGNIGQHQTPRAHMLGTAGHQHNPRRSAEFLVDSSMAMSPYGSGMAVAPGTPPYGAFGMFSYGPAIGQEGGTAAGLGSAGGRTMQGMMSPAAPAGYAMQYPAAGMPPQYMYIQPATIPGFAHAAPPGYGTFHQAVGPGGFNGRGRVGMMGGRSFGGYSGGVMPGNTQRNQYQQSHGGGGGGRGQ